MAFSNWDSGLSEAENHTGCCFYDPPYDVIMSYSNKIIKPNMLAIKVLIPR